MSASYCGQIRRRSNLGSGRDLTFSQGDHTGMSVEMVTRMMTKLHDLIFGPRILQTKNA